MLMRSLQAELGSTQSIQDRQFHYHSPNTFALSNIQSTETGGLFWKCPIRDSLKVT